jgi:Cupin-like domain
MRPIPERANVDAEIFHNEILPAAQPVLLRQLVPDWPVVQAGRRSPQALSDYIRRFDRGAFVNTMLGPPEIKGRFFYNDDLSGLNFQQGSAEISGVLDYILQHLGDETPAALAVTSVPARANLPGFEAENSMPLLADVEPRAWIGNAVIVAAHNDPLENIACVVAGRRRFTLFPPDQIANLYIGPFELTPAGAAISMVSFDAPDLQRHPKFADALEAASVAELEPGDAIYIPYLWWHHVRSIDSLNMLVNYWWKAPPMGRGVPRDALLHAMLAIKELPASHRQAWMAIFEHYVFKQHGEPGEHLPLDRRGILGAMDEASIRNARAELARVLAEQSP